MALAPFARQRRRVRALARSARRRSITVGGYILVALANGPTLPPGLASCSRGCSASTSSRTSRSGASRPYADGTLLPLAAMLNGIGFVMIARLAGADRLRQQARVQSVWVTIGIARVRPHADRRPRRAHLRALPVHRRCCSASRSCCSRSRRRSGSTINGGRLWVGDRPAHLRAERDREGAARRVLRRVPRRQARAAHAGPHPHRALVRPVAARPRAAAARVGHGAARARVRAGHRHVAAVLRRVRGDALHDDATRRVSRRHAHPARRSARVVAYKAFGHVRVRVENWTNPWPTRQRRAAARPVQGWYALGSGGIAGTGLGLGQPVAGPERVDRLHVHVDRRRARARRLDRRHRRVHAARRQRVPHRGRRGPAVHEAVRGRHRDDHRPPDVPDHRRRHARDPAHRHLAAVRLLRRLVAGRELRAARDPAAHLRRHGARRATAGCADEHRHPARRHRDDRAVRRARRAAHLPPGRATATSSPTTSGNPRKFLANIRRDRGPIETADGVVVAHVDADQRRVQVPARLPGRHRDAVRATSSATSRSSTARSASRTTYSSELEGRDLRPAGRATSPTRSRTSSRSAPSCSRCRRRRRARPRSRSAASAAASSCSTCRPAASLAAVLEPHVRSRTCSRRTTRRRRRPRTRSCTHAPDNPLLARAWRELYPPGSTFKTVTASIALQNNVDVDKKFPVVDRSSRSRRRTASALQLRRARSAAARCSRTASSSRATRRSRRSASISATRSRPASRSSACRPHRRRRRLRHRPADRREHRAAAGHVPARTSRSSCRTRSARTRSLVHAAARWRSSPKRSRTRASILQPHVVDCVLDPNDKVVSRGRRAAVQARRSIPRPPTR